MYESRTKRLFRKKGPINITKKSAEFIENPMIQGERTALSFGERQEGYLGRRLGGLPARTPTRASRKHADVRQKLVKKNADEEGDTSEA